MFDLCGPMRGCAPNDARNLFMEGDLKFKDNLGKVRLFANALIFNSNNVQILFRLKHPGGRSLLSTDGYAVGVQNHRKKGIGNVKGKGKKSESL